MKSHPEARILYLVAARTGVLKGCRVLATLVCQRGHKLGTVYMIQNRPVVAMRQKAQQIPDPDAYRAAIDFERRYGTRLIPHTQAVTVVDMLDENDPTAPAPVLRGDCGCRPPTKPIGREWLAEKCKDLERTSARRRRIVVN